MKMDERNEFRMMRLRKRISLVEVARILKCTSSHVGNYEMNRTNMDTKKIKKYKKYIIEKRKEV